MYIGVRGISRACPNPFERALGPCSHIGAFHIESGFLSLEDLHTGQEAFRTLVSSLHGGGFQHGLHVELLHGLCHFLIPSPADGMKRSLSLRHRHLRRASIHKRICVPLHLSLCGDSQFGSLLIEPIDLPMITSPFGGLIEWVRNPRKSPEFSQHFQRECDGTSVCQVDSTAPLIQSQ